MMLHRPVLGWAFIAYLELKLNHLLESQIHGVKIIMRHIYVFDSFNFFASEASGPTVG